MKRAIIAVGCLFTAGVSGVAWAEARRGQKAVRERTEVALANARTVAAITVAEQRLAAAERDGAALRPALKGVSRAAAVAPAPASTAAATDVAALFRKFGEREKDPKVQAVRLASWRAQLLTSHGAFFRRQGLTPSQVGRFQDITARRWEQNRDLNDILQEAKAKGNGGEETAAAVAKLKNQVKAEFEAAQRELLGDTGYGALREYERSGEARAMVIDLAGAAVVAGVPFSAQQAEELTQVLANASQSYRDGGAAHGYDIHWSHADEQARGILSAPQMVFIQTVAPPRSGSGRFNQRVQGALAEATKAEAERKQTEGTPPAGG